MNDEIYQKMQDMLDAHNAAFGALRRANGAMYSAISEHDIAIQAALMANQAAMDVLALMRKEGQ